MLRLVRLTIGVTVFAYLLAVGHVSRAAPGSDHNTKRLDEEIAATRARLADLEHRRAHLQPATVSEPGTRIVVGYYRKKTTIK